MAELFTLVSKLGEFAVAITHANPDLSGPPDAADAVHAAANAAVESLHNMTTILINYVSNIPLSDISH